MGEKSNIQITYEFAMIIMAALSVATLWYSTGVDGYIVWITWGIFFIDFIFRLFKSENKWAFVKANPFIVIAAVPLDAIFQLARLARLLHLLRLKTITKYYTMPFISYLKNQKLYFVFAGALLFVILLIIPLYSLEPGLESYGEALMSSLISVIVFYSASFDPTTIVGHGINVVLTIIGVILHGIVLSAAFDAIVRSASFQKMWRKVSRSERTSYPNR
ncbi:hypothetical protein [Natribacillus halophilus]|nr:hypothetical protein [Natribacillus halophilus]